MINKQGKPFFVEVKFRTDFVVYSKDIGRLDFIERFWQAKIILVTTQPPYFRVSNSPYLNEKQQWNWISLKEDPDLEISDNILKQFDDLVGKYYLK